MEQLIDLMPLDCIHENGAFYPFAVVSDAVDEFNKRIEPRNGALGECTIPILTNWQGPPEARYLQVDLSRASHIVRHVWIDDFILKCKVTLLGQYAEMAREMDFHFLGVPRATGVTGDDGVCTKYTLITVDLALPELT